MFQSKKKKIMSYLENKQSTENLTVFDVLLHDYLSGNLKSEFDTMGFSHIEIHIDWLDDYRCIEVTGRYGKYQVEIKIEASEFTIAYDEDEPEEYKEYPLINKQSLYTEIQTLLNGLK